MTYDPDYHDRPDPDTWRKPRETPKADAKHEIERMREMLAGEKK